MKLLVRGEALFPENAPAVSGATLYVRLQDVSYADAPARLIAEQVIPDVSWSGKGPHRVEFALEGSVPDERADYAVAAHLDVDGDGRVSRGDYLSLERHPVRAARDPGPVSVRLEPIP
jgi:uncharacterized lipoprotein YbaY